MSRRETTIVETRPLRAPLTSRLIGDPPSAASAFWPDLLSGSTRMLQPTVPSGALELVPSHPARSFTPFSVPDLLGIGFSPLEHLEESGRLRELRSFLRAGTFDWTQVTELALSDAPDDAVLQSTRTPVELKRRAAFGEVKHGARDARSAWPLSTPGSRLLADGALVTDDRYSTERDASSSEPPTLLEQEGDAAPLDNPLRIPTEPARQRPKRFAHPVDAPAQRRPDLDSVGTRRPDLDSVGAPVVLFRRLRDEVYASASRRDEQLIQELASRLQDELINAGVAPQTVGAWFAEMTGTRHIDWLRDRPGAPLTTLLDQLSLSCPEGVNPTPVLTQWRAALKRKDVDAVSMWSGLAHTLGRPRPRLRPKVVKLALDSLHLLLARGSPAQQLDALRAVGAALIQHDAASAAEKMRALIDLPNVRAVAPRDPYLWALMS